MRAIYNLLSDRIEKRFRVDAHYFLSGGFWLSVGQFFGIAFGLATTVLFAHNLNETDYGIYRYLISLSVIFTVFSLTGIEQSVLQTAAQKFFGFYKKTLGTNLLYGLGTATVATVGALYYWFNDNTLLATGCILAALLLPFINTFNPIQPFLIGSKRFRESTFLHVVKMLFVASVSIGTLFITHNILVLFAAYLTSNLLANLVAHIVFSPKTHQVPKETLNKYLSYAKHTSVRNFIGNIAYRMDTIIIFTQLGAMELAIYSIANVIPEQIKGSLKNLSTLLLPKYASHSDPTLLKKSVPKRSLQLLIILLAITLVFILLAPLIFSVLFPKYEEAVLLSQLVALSFPATVAIIPFGIIQAQLMERELHRINIWTSVVNLSLTITFILTLGLIGAIVAKILSRYFSMFINYFYLYRN